VWLVGVSAGMRVKGGKCRAGVPIGRNCHVFCGKCTQKRAFCEVLSKKCMKRARRGPGVGSFRIANCGTCIHKGAVLGGGGVLVRHIAKFPCTVKCPGPMDPRLVPK